MSFPAQTFATIAELVSYINQYIIPNGNNEISGEEHNNVENALATFIVSYTLNSSGAALVTSGGVVTLTTPITVIASALPTSVAWTTNVQKEFYIVNLLGVSVPLAGGLSYTDPNSIVRTSISPHAAVHIAQAANGSWFQVNNLLAPGNLPPFGPPGQALFNDGTEAFWGDLILQIPPNDPNWVNANTWQNGFAEDNPSFSSGHFALFWNEFSRYLLQNDSPPEWRYVSDGFQVLIPGWDHTVWNANMFLTFKGENS